MSNQPFLLIHLLAGLFALGVATVSTPIVGRVAGRIGLVAYPKRDRWHRTPTPLLGGVAIFLGIAIATEPGRAAYVPLRHEGGVAQASLPDAIRLLGPVLEDRHVLKVFHDGKFALAVLGRAGAASGLPWPPGAL